MSVAHGSLSKDKGGAMNKISKNCRSLVSRGFSLIEILVAVVILSVGILAVSQMTVMGLRVNTINNQRMYARVAMSQVFEELNNLPFDDPLVEDWDNDPSDLDDTDSTADFSQTIADSLAHYSLKARWNVADNVPEVDLKTIRIHILWGPDDAKKVSTDLIKPMS
jgi:prepilin-type N-terminal cleavage/methylation domain-containing protein